MGGGKSKPNSFYCGDINSNHCKTFSGDMGKCLDEVEAKCNAKKGCRWYKIALMGMAKKCYDENIGRQNDLMSALMLDSMDVGVLSAVDDNSWDQDE